MIMKHFLVPKQFITVEQDHLTDNTEVWYTHPSHPDNIIGPFQWSKSQKVLLGMDGRSNGLPGGCTLWRPGYVIPG